MAFSGYSCVAAILINVCSDINSVPSASCNNGCQSCVPSHTYSENSVTPPQSDSQRRSKMLVRCPFCDGHVHEATLEYLLGNPQH